MREITTVTKVYEFDELGKKAQEKALAELHYINVDYEWHANSIGDFITILDNIGVDTLKENLQFSGFSSQGDGLSFTGYYYYCKGALAWIKSEWPKWTALHNAVLSLQEIQRKHFYRISGNIVRYNHRYSHSKTVEFEGSDYSEEIEREITDILRDIMDAFYRQLDEEYDYFTSDECIKESIFANGYEFTIEGKMI
jgi:hypothetical protein